ncbi:MAG: hypothetical protein PHS34_07660 [Candidatus Omnitrophica bacterium]|nr:hypothetical protein [Candidatus Omnitrophota bacterium]
MQFFNSTNKENSLYHDCLALLGLSSSDTTSYPIADFTRSANEAYKLTNQIIWQSTGEWEFDDSNYETLPVATRDMVADQKDYLLPSYAQKIDRLEVMDNSEDWQVVIPFDKSMEKDAMTELYSSTGLPKYYDLVGDSLILYPTPDATYCTLTAGLKLYFSREIDEFAVDDTTKEPGFNSDFHRMISLGAALDWAAPKGLNLMGGLQNQIKDMKENIKKFYGSRDRDLKVRIIPPYKLYK